MCFSKGLSGRIQDLLVPLNLPPDLDTLISLAIRTDHRLQERQQRRNRWSSAEDRHQRRIPTSTSQGGSFSHLPANAPRVKESPGEGEEPTQLRHTKLSAEERRRQQQEGRCFYCGQQDHLPAACPAKGLVSCTSSTKSSPGILTVVQVTHRDTMVTLGALINSGADESLMDWGLAHKLSLKTERLPQPIEASALYGSPLFRITHKTEKILVRINDHETNMSFHVFSAPSRSLMFRG